MQSKSVPCSSIYAELRLHEGGYIVKLSYLGNHSLELWVVEPRKLADLSKQDYHHAHDLTIALEGLVREEVQQVILDSLLFLDGNLAPIVSQEVLES